MPYQQQFWRDYDENLTETQNIERGAVVTTERLNNIENGIVSNYSNMDNKKVDKGGAGQVSWGMLAQDAREQISGGTVAVVGKDSVSGLANIIDNSVPIANFTNAAKTALKVYDLKFQAGHFQLTNYDGSYQSGINQSGNRIVSDQIFKVKKGAKLKLFSPNWLWTVHYFNPDYTLLEQGTVWYSDQEKIFEKDSYISAQLCKVGNGNILPADYTSEILTISDDTGFEIDWLDGRTERVSSYVNDFKNGLSIQKNLSEEYFSDNHGGYQINDQNQIVSIANAGKVYKWLIFSDQVETFSFYQVSSVNSEVWIPVMRSIDSVIAVKIRRDATPQMVIREFREDGAGTSKPVANFPLIAVDKHISIERNLENVIIRADEEIVADFNPRDYFFGTYTNCLGVLQASNWSGACVNGPLINVKNGKIAKIENDIEELKVKAGLEDQKSVDLVIFAGQSNMAGRGAAAEAPVVPSGHGYEFRAISNPSELVNIVEPFGVNENKIDGINENTKTGSLVSALVNAYYDQTKKIIVGVSASKGGTRVDQWQPNGILLPDALQRFQTAQNWLTDNGYKIRNKWLVWCQGESDGDVATSKEAYKTGLANIIGAFEDAGVEHSFIIRIGNHRDDATKYDEIIQAQTELCKVTKNVTLIATTFDRMASDGLMKDEFHYTQEGYDVCGEQAGKNLAFFENNKKEPTIFDWENQNLYFSEKN